MDNPPIVSVVLPTLGVDSYFEAAVRSITHSTFTDYELVVVGPESQRPALLSVLSEISSISKFVYVSDQGNGLAQALNDAVSACRGKFIARLDADDLMEEARIERQVAFLDSHPEVSVVGSQVRYICSMGHEQGTSSYPTWRSAVSPFRFHMNPLAHPAVMFRKSDFDRAGGYNPLFSVCEDLELWIRLTGLGPVVNLNEPLTRYRIHGNQASILLAQKIRTFNVLAFIKNTSNSASNLAKVVSEFDYSSTQSISEDLAKLLKDAGFDGPSSARKRAVAALQLYRITDWRHADKLESQRPVAMAVLDLFRLLYANPVGALIHFKNVMLSIFRFQDQAVGRCAACDTYQGQK